MFQTEYNFKLPKGYVDEEGNLHQEGKMRLATAMDEIAPLKDPRVKANPAYLSIILLSRVIIQLGDIPNESVTPATIENLFASDLSYLQEFYENINKGTVMIRTTCPKCGHDFDIDIGSGE